MISTKIEYIDQNRDVEPIIHHSSIAFNNEHFSYQMIFHYKIGTMLRNAKEVAHSTTDKIHIIMKKTELHFLLVRLPGLKILTKSSSIWSWRGPCLFLNTFHDSVHKGGSMESLILIILFLCILL